MKELGSAGRRLNSGAMLGSVKDLLERLLVAPGLYWGHGDGPESGRFVGRIAVEPMLSAVLLKYEAHGEAGLQHVEHSVLGRSPTGLKLHTVIDTRQELMTFVEEQPGVFTLDGPTDMRIVIDTPEPGTLSYAWWWSPPGENVIERSRLVAQLNSR
jgi:hypothetical protein